MLRFSSTLLALVFAIGCSHPPLQHEENLPSLEDSFPDREQVMFGTSTFTVTEGNGGPFLCDQDFSIIGWAEPDADVSVAGCTGCTEDFKLSLIPEADEGCHSVGGLPTIAIADINMLPVVDESYADYLDGRVPDGADGDAVAFGMVDWSPSTGNQDSFSPVLALYLKEQDSGLPDFRREYLGVGRFYWGLGDGTGVTWRMDIRLLE